jgi:hypothetical protein
LLQRSEYQVFIVASLNTLVADLKKSFDFLKNHPLLGTTSTPAGIDHGDLPTDAFSKITAYLKQTSANDLVEFITNPRFDDPTYLRRRQRLGLLIHHQRGPAEEWRGLGSRDRGLG